MKMKTWNILIFFSTILCFCISCQQDSNNYTSWNIYHGDKGGNSYSALNQVNTDNVQDLKVAWTYNTGDKSEYFSLECNPIIIGDILYGISPKLKTFALNAKTGKQLWIVNPFPGNSKEGGFNRGLTYFKYNDQERIFIFVNNKLISLDAKTGKQITNFGDSGYVDLNKGLQENSNDNNELVSNTSPGVIYNDLIITGSSVGEDYNSAPGDLRAYNAITGKLKWTFHTVPHPGEAGYDSVTKDNYKNIGGCNAWSGLTIDSKTGVLFAATGAPSFDFHGGERPGKNLYGNCVLALDAATGKLIWHFQISHHDLWDYDLPSPPNLVTIKKDGKVTDAVAQITKQGYIFILDRKTGKPVFPVEEKLVAPSEMQDEQSSPTQPVPLKPLPLCRQKFEESIITDLSPESHDFVLKEAKKYTWGDIYLPPSTKGIIQMPGFRGGAEWSGACVDMETGIMYVSINDIPNIVQLVERKEKDNKALSQMSVKKAGEMLFQTNCALCHGSDLKGNNSFPSLEQLANKFNVTDLITILNKPKGMMPSFNKRLNEQEKHAIAAFLLNSNETSIYLKSKNDTSISESRKTRYALKGYFQLLDQNGYPGVKPPWGTLNAVDLNNGELKWKIPLGSFPDLAAKGFGNTGTQLFGGGIVTAGGLIFIGASQDEKFRAIDKTTGQILWEYQLPCGGYATPSTYVVDGKQYVVIAAGGGGRQRTKAGDYYIAFALK
ncbi:MAG TPA: PQQ-binding-like beta-propeller repeat protein [Flavitalea sp.]|nr:PQQ-binding-like beta-propeller repeat protein [Flavitalea sp.]